MIGFGRRFLGRAVIVVYWCCALLLLYRVSPISFDGDGPTATFYWGNHEPTPTCGEYDRNIGVRLQFEYPYWCAATIVTLAGCVVAPWLVRRWRPRRSRIIALASTATLLLLLLVCAVADLSVALHMWWGPMTYASLANMWVSLKVMIPMSLLAGVLAFVGGINKILVQNGCGGTQ